MLEPSKPPRDVAEQQSFRICLDAIEPSCQRSDELIEAIKWEVARDPEALPELPGTPFRLARSQEVLGGEILRVFFTIDSEEVCSLWWADRTPDPVKADEEEDDFG